MKHDFIVMGFSKCATTTIDAVLRQHKNIVLPSFKESQYLDRPGIWNNSMEWYYKRYFPHKSEKWYEGKYVGEVNPWWQHHGREAVERFGTDCKYVFVVRNPIHRLISHYKHLVLTTVNFANAHKNFDEFNSFIRHNFRRVDKTVSIAEGTWTELFLSNYYEYIMAVAKRVPKENIKVILFEEFIQDQEKGIKDLLFFLGIEPDAKIDYLVRDNMGNRIAKSRDSIRKFASRWKYIYYHVICDWKYMPYWLGRILDQVVWKVVYILYTKESDAKVELSSANRKRLEEYYRPMIKKLGEYLGRDLSEIWF